MVSKDNPFPDLDKDALHRAIAMHAAPLGRAALATLFGYDEDTQEELNALLNELIEESHITLDTRGYMATAPWADIAYATVGDIRPGKQRVQLHLLNIPATDAPVVTLSQNDIVKHDLKTGQRIVVGLDRGLAGTGTDLRARFIAAADQSFHLVGVFNQKAQNFAPLDRTIKTDFKLTQTNGMTNLPHQFVVELPADFDPRTPRATIVLDQSRDINTGAAIGDIVASKHGISKTHSAAAIIEADALYRSRINFKGRTDLRHMDFVTVDPLGSTDLDDAFYATVEKDGYAVYTAIADVAALVHYNTAIDREAYEAGSTFYMGDNTSHMLPGILSTRKASLIPGHNRPAMIVKQVLDWDARLTSFEVFAGVIRSRTQLSYGQFYDLLERSDPRFRTINNIHEMRRKNGDNKELEALLKESAGQYSSKSLIETLMVQSNSLMAKFLDASGVPFLSRNLEPGDPTNTRAVQRAHYATHRTGHAQLGLLHYAHITSPIRRYADIVNMRAIHKALGTPGLGLHDDEIANLDKTATHLNGRRNVERDVNHDMEKYHAIQDLTRVQSTPVRLFINEIGKGYVELTIVQTGLRQRLTGASLPANQWRIDAEKLELVMLDDQGNESNRYRQKETILGRVHNVDPTRAQWDLKLSPQDNLARPSAKTGTGPKPTL